MDKDVLYKLAFPLLIRNFATIYGTQNSVMCLEEPTIGPFPVTNKSCKVLYKETNKMHFQYVFILQFLYKATFFERPFRSSSGVHELLYKPCKRV